MKDKYYAILGQKSFLFVSHSNRLDVTDIFCMRKNLNCLCNEQFIHFYINFECALYLRYQECKSK